MSSTKVIHYLELRHTQVELSSSLTFDIAHVVPSSFCLCNFNVHVPEPGSLGTRLIGMWYDMKHSVTTCASALSNFFMSSARSETFTTTWFCEEEKRVRP